MQENEFDIQVRNLLLNAEESVSPEVWEGVEARLNQRRRVVPFRRWAWAAVAAAAAAVVAGIVFLRPAPVPSLTPATLAEAAPSEVAPVTSMLPTVGLQPESAPETLPEVRPAIAYRAAEQTPEIQPVISHVQAIPAASPELLQLVRTPERLQVPGVPSAASLAEEQRLLDLLARAETQPQSNSGLSLLASGNFQSNQRASASTDAGPHFGAPPTGASIGIYDESPEVSFGFPYSAGIGVKFNFAPNWAVGTGVRYTNLSRTFVGDYVGDGFLVVQSDIDNQQHWLGIPLNLYYDLVNRGSWRVHSFVGVAGEYLLDNHFLVHNSPKDIHYHQKSNQLQWSAALGLGVEFKVTPTIGIYLDPNFRYYFRTDLQPRSIRTVQPLRFDLEVGLRFTL